MGKSYTVRNVVSFIERMPNGASRSVSMAWDSKTNGQANIKNLERFIVSYLKSMMPGGVNAHLCRDGVVPNISAAHIRNQFSGALLEWKAPMFFVIE